MKSIFTVVLFLAIPLSAYSQVDCFPAVQKHNFIYDQATLLTPIKNTLQANLSAFTKQTSNVLVIITTKDLCGYDKSTYAIEFGDQNGIGRVDKDNGIVLLIKPKTPQAKGQVFIAIGTGLQGAITDVTANRIIQKELIPNFKKGDYQKGVQQASDVLMRLAKNEISQANYQKDNFRIPLDIIFILLFLLFFFLPTKKSTPKNAQDWSHFDRHGKHHGSGGFSDNDASGSSGFGGFGGGGFSGGGSGGSW